MRVPIYVVAAATLFACGESNYVYRPDTANAFTSAGLPAERTPIPQERPQGAVEVTSYGTTLLEQGPASVPVLHARMIVTNDGDDTPWTLDTRRQTLSIANEGNATPLYANADVQSLPNLTIAKGERRVIDLYFPLPGNVATADRLPHFDLLWEVNTADRVVSSRTSFDRVEVQDQPQYAYDTTWPLWAGWGPYWWWDPLYPSTVFVHTRPVVIRDHRAPVHVGSFAGHFRAAHTRVTHR